MLTNEQRERHTVRVEKAGGKRPYWWAECTCGWLGATHDQSEPAYTDQDAHITESGS